MRSCEAIIGLPVIDLATGEQVGSVKRLIFDETEQQLRGIVLQEGGWFKEARIVPYTAVSSIGDNAVIIDTTAVIADTGDLDRPYPEAREHPSLRGMRMITDGGQEIGVIDDLLLDTWNGRVVGYRLSDGLLQDWVEGKAVLPVPENQIVGTEAIIVPENVVGTIQRKHPGESRR